MKIISITPTPNPDALKFTVDREIVAEGSKSFMSPALAEDDILAKNLFTLDGVVSVFYMANFITINKTPEFEWDTLEDSIILTIKQFEPEISIETEKKADSSNKQDKTEQPFESLTPAQKILYIDDILEDEIRPGLAGDGGGLEIVDLDGYTLMVRYEGACGSCPSSTAGTLMYIESMLRERINEEIRVVPV